MPHSDAFTRMYEEHRRPIVRYLRRRLGDDAAEDAASEVFSRAFHARHDYQDQYGTPLPWLYGIATNVIAERRRAEHRRLKVLERLATQHAHSHPPPGEPAPLDPRLARALRRLTHDDRETLLLVAWGELSYEETAATLGVPVGTVRSRLSRVRRQLQDSATEVRDATPTTLPNGEAHV